MILKNYYSILAGQILAHGSMKYVDYNGTQKTYENTSCQSPTLWLVPTNVSVATNYTGSGVIFGDGDTLPTADDYKLAGNIISTLSPISTHTYLYDDDGCSGTTVYTLTNNGSEAVTIKEMATLSGLSLRALVERTVLDTPVTIPAGGVGQVTYTIRMNYPTA